MDPDNLKQAWQTQDPRSHPQVNVDLLLKEVQRNQRYFTAMIFWRDVREIGLSLVLLPIWIYMGVKLKPPWTWYLAVPAIVWVAGFMLVDRIRHSQHVPPADAPLRSCVQNALAQVDHQIWLLRNVIWWYLMPLFLPMTAFFGQFLWEMRDGGWWTILSFFGFMAIGIVVNVFVYRLNQFAVRSELAPRQHELQQLLASLNDEARDI